MNKKHIYILAALLLLLTPAVAQNPNHKGSRQRDITEMVSDLSQSQKKRLDAITEESKSRVNALRARQKAVRDSIAMFMNMDGDHSDKIFPLFDREADLQRAISREMYSTKVRIDEVLTPEQRKKLRQSCTKQKSYNPDSQTKKTAKPKH